MVRDTFLWGISSDGVGNTSEWPSAAEEINVTAYDNESTNFAGFLHDFTPFSPTVTFSRYRGFLAFYTSGYMDVGYATSAKLRLYIVDSWGAITEESSSSVADDFTIIIQTVSGYWDRHKAYSDSYGFTNNITWQSAWGPYPLDYVNNPLSQTCFEGSYQTIVDASTTGTKFLDGDDLPYRFSQGWMEFDIPLEYINLIGETQFKIASLKELENTTPEVGDGHQDHFNWLSYHSSQGVNIPELEIVYTPELFPIKELRMVDLSLQRYLQNIINNNATFSGSLIRDGYPGDEYFIDKTREISIEHLSSISNPLGLSHKTRKMNSRRFAIDIVCDKKGELADFTSLITSKLYNRTISLLDFSYGFLLPKPSGKIYCAAIRVMDLPSFMPADRHLYRNIILLDVDTIRN